MCITCCSLVIQCNEVPISISCPDCPENGFRCDKSKLCIDSFSVCDGKDDCGDNSDEMFCKTQPNLQVRIVDIQGNPSNEGS